MKQCIKYQLYLRNECQDSANVDQVKRWEYQTLTNLNWDKYWTNLKLLGTVSIKYNKPCHRKNSSSFEAAGLVLYRIALQFKSCLGNRVIEKPVTFQSDRTILDVSAVVSTPWEILRYDGQARLIGFFVVLYIDGLVQDCSIPIANALLVLKSCSKPSTYRW